MYLTKRAIAQHVNSVFYTFTRALSKHAIVQKLHYHVVHTYRTKRAIAQHINCLLLHYYVVDVYWTKRIIAQHVNSVCYTFTRALSKRAIAQNVATHYEFKHYVINMRWASCAVAQCFYLLYYYLAINMYWTKHAIAQHVNYVWYTFTRHDQYVSAQLRNTFFLHIYIFFNASLARRT